MKIVKQYWEFPEYKIVGGEGFRVTVEQEGKRYECTDMNSGYWQYLFGYQHPEFLKVFSDPLSHQPPSLFTSLHEETEVVGREVERLTGFSHILWLSSGSGAVDAAIRMADLIRPGRTIVSIKNSFHGSNATALAASGFEFMHATSFVKEESFLTIKLNGEGTGEIERLASEDRLACVVFEPIQGVGGCFVMPREFLESLQKLRERYDFLLIADEVSSFARTGSLLASKTFPFQPDLVCLGKGISGGYVPVSLVLASDEVIERHEQVGNFFYGNTLAGTSLACRTVHESFRLLEEGGFAGIRGLGGAIDLCAREYSISVRGLGIMRALDLGSKKHADRVSQELMMKHGFFTIPEGRYLMLMPPLITPVGEIRRFFQAVKTMI